MTKTLGFPKTLSPLIFAAILVLTTVPAAAAPRPGLTSPPPARPAAAAPRPMPNFNMAAVRPPLPTTPPAAKAPQLSRPFYVARDRYPSNGGFAAGTGRVTTIKPGTIVGRKGDGDGRYATKNWAPKAGSLGLEPKADRQPMRYWRVKQPIITVSGKAAPAWSAPGGANQLALPNRVDTLARKGYMQRTIAPNFRMSANRR